MKILKLVYVWRSNKKVVLGNEPHNGVLVSKVSSSQILQRVKEGIRKAESVVLKALEKPVYGASGPGEKNMVPLWACLWSLILTYRDCMMVYRQFSFAKRLNTRQPRCSGKFFSLPLVTVRNTYKTSDFELLVDSSKHMYHIMTANYSTLFRVSSPLYMDWSIGTNFELIGKSPVLEAAFHDLRMEVVRFCMFCFSRPKTNTDNTR